MRIQYSISGVLLILLPVGSMAQTQARVTLGARARIINVLTLVPKGDSTAILKGGVRQNLRLQGSRTIDRQVPTINLIAPTIVPAAWTQTPVLRHLAERTQNVSALHYEDGGLHVTGDAGFAYELTVAVSSASNTSPAVSLSLEARTGNLSYGGRIGSLPVSSENEDELSEQDIEINVAPLRANSGGQVTPVRVTAIYN